MISCLKKLNAIITAILTTVAIIVAVIGLLATTTFRGEIKALIVRSGSMEPTLPVGSLIVAKKASQYQVGDVITFTQQNNFVTHRIIEVLDNQYRTQGDANKVADTNLVASSSVIGKLWFSVPSAGKALAFIKKPAGFGLLIMLPALWIVIGEIFAIGREIDKIKRAKAEAKKKIVDMRVVPTKAKIERLTRQENKASKQRLSQAIVMMVIALLGGLSGTKAYFTDIAQSTNNYFTAGIFGPQIATHLVINEIYTTPDQAHFINGAGGSNRGEWIEIYNPTENSLSVLNWSVDADGSNITLPNLTVPSNGFLIISGATEAELRAKWTIPATGTTFMTTSGGKIGNGFDAADGYIKLKDDSAAVIDQVSWGGDTTAFNPSLSTILSGQSVERDPDGVDTHTSADFVVRSSPQPGQ